MSTEEPVPPAESTLQRLWGQQPRRRRGPKPALSVERIVEAAFELAEAEGLGAVSMARVSESLGYSPMALYRHVGSKDELLILLTDRGADLLEDLPDGLGWRDGLELWTRRQIEMALAHPWYLDLPVATVPPGPRRVRWIDQALRVMAGLDLPFDAKLSIVGLLAQHVLGEARVQIETRRAAVEQVRRTGEVGPDTPDDELDPGALARANPFHDFEMVLSRLATPDQFPHLFAALATWEPPEEHETAQEDELSFALDILLDGIEAYVRRRTGS